MTHHLATITDKPWKLPLDCPTTVHVSGEMLEQGLVSLICATDAIDSLMKHTDPFSKNRIWMQTIKYIVIEYLSVYRLY